MEPSREAQVGILFVHGIGQQTPGDTLISFGEPLMGWVRRWLESRKSAREFQILGSNLGPPVLGPEEPAHLLFQCARTDIEAPVHSRWLLAESCWATEFRNPPFGRMAAWMVGVGAWTILSHCGKFLRLRLAGWKRWALGAPLLLVAVLLALAVQLLVAVLGLAALIPVPRLRRALSGLLLTLTGTLGDSYVLVSSPVQEAAAVSRLQTDLFWLSDRVEKVFVVAHSQGAAIALRALQGPRPSNVCRLMTFGAGIGKLEELRHLARPANRHQYLRAQFGLPLATLSILLLPRAVATLKSSSLLLGWDLYVSSLIVLAPLLIVTMILADAWSGSPRDREHLREKLSLPGLEWRDFYSTADPVPNGPLVEESEGLPGLAGREVVNLRSAVADHSAYWANQEEFVAAIVQEIDSEAGTGLVLLEEADAIAKASVARQKRVWTLVAMRAATAAGAVLGLLGLWSQLPNLAEELVWKPLTTWASTGLLGSVAGIFGSGFGAVARLVTGASAETLRTWGLVALGALLLPLVVALCYLVATRAWKWWDRFATDDFFTRDWKLSTEGAAAVAVVLGATPLIFGGAALATGDLGASLGVVGVTFRWYFMALALIVLLVPALVIAYFSLWALRPAAKYWSKNKLKLIVAGVTGWVALCLSVLSVAMLVTRDLQRSLDVVLVVNLRLAAVVLFVVVILLGGYAWLFIGHWWQERTRR